jgi:hypothetical protein
MQSVRHAIRLASRSAAAVRLLRLLWLSGLMLGGHPQLSAAAQDPSPPGLPVKLVFIHHSVGEGWLADGNGGLGEALGRNNYFVSDSNYGWGPQGIGDRTDITDWPEWFTGPQSPAYTQALYRLRETRSPFTRRVRDPGGENRIVMFKSCFPNSELEGRPADPPRRGEGLTVSNAKAIYNELLDYFASRPDKLFIAVTAPPVIDRRLGHNARAFNNWLTHEWLSGYDGYNVAVFDLFNVLTGPNNHHRFHKGQIQHRVAGTRNTLFYSTGDDAHPTPAGTRKATAEFVPLLNVYYHRWQAWLPDAPGAKAFMPKVASESARPKEPSRPHTACGACTPPTQVKPGGLIDDFEGIPKGWEVFSDAGQPQTRLTCGAEKGTSFKGETALAIHYEIAPQSWATCSLVLPSAEDWSRARGLSLRLRTEPPARKVSVVVYGGHSDDRLMHYEHAVPAGAANLGRWQSLEMTWGQFTQPPWEGDGTATFNPSQAKGIAFAFDAPEGGSHAGTLWVDEIRFSE